MYRWILIHRDIDSTIFVFESRWCLKSSKHRIESRFFFVPGPHYLRLGWREKMQEIPIFGLKSMGSQRFSLQLIQWHDWCHIQIRVPADSSLIPMAWPQVSNCGADEMEWEEEQEEANTFCATAIGIPVIQWKGHSFKVTWWWTYGWWWTTMDGMGSILFSDKTIWMGWANYACSWGSSGTSERGNSRNYADRW